VAANRVLYGDWDWNTSTGVDDPGTGYLSLSADGHTFSVSTLDHNDVDHSADLGDLRTGDQLFVQERTSGNDWVTAYLTGQPSSFDANWWVVPVAAATTSGPPQNDDDMIVAGFRDTVTAGWPADSDLADWLGLAGGDDTARVAQANAAAKAAALYFRPDLDPVNGPGDDELWEAVLMLGAWWYEVRNKPEGLDSLNPVATPYGRRTAIGILQRGKMPVA
jgi:hypothetical protein